MKSAVVSALKRLHLYNGARAVYARFLRTSHGRDPARDPQALLEELRERNRSTSKVVSPTWDRIPQPLREAASTGEYQRINPYPAREIVRGFGATPFITRQTKIITMGSCFAQELNRWLVQNDYTCLPHEWGVVYSPQSIAQIVQYSVDSDRWEEPQEPFWKRGGKYFDPYIKADSHAGPAFRGDTEPAAQTAQRSHRNRSSALLRQAEVVVWALGLTEVWRNRHDHKAYYAVPFPETYDPERHEFYSLTYQDVIEALDYAITTLRGANPSVKILLSVSPVPLSVSFRDHLGPYIATQYSKSVLHAATLALVEDHEDVFYMPSYEITRSDPLLHYQPDGRHVNQDCVSSIMEVFQQLYVAAVVPKA